MAVDTLVNMYSQSLVNRPSSVAARENLVQFVAYNTSYFAEQQNGRHDISTHKWFGK